MFDYEIVINYIENLRDADEFNKLDPSEKNKAVFTSHEKLKDYFPEDKITVRAVALQTLYAMEGEAEEFAKLKRHGVKSYSVKGVSVTFDGSGISPDVIRLIPGSSNAKVKQLK